MKQKKDSPSTNQLVMSVRNILPKHAVDVVIFTPPLEGQKRMIVRIAVYQWIEM